VLDGERAVPQQESPLDDVAQLPDVAGPVVHEERVPDPLVQAWHFQVVPSGQNAQEMLGQENDVIASFAQRR